MAKLSIALAAAAGLTAAPAAAQTQITFWHAMGGPLGEQVEAIAAGFNESQADYVVAPVYKGDYAETMTAALAAFSAGEPPHIVQVFDVGTASMMAATGAIRPVHEIMEDTDAFDREAFLPAVKSYYATTDGRLLSLPFNASTPVLWVNRDVIGSAVPQTWDQMFDLADRLQANGHDCAFSFGWQSWVMIENYLAWHDTPIGTAENGLASFSTELVFDDAAELAALLQRISDSQADGVFKYGGRRGASLPLFTSGECAMWINSSAYYVVISDYVEFAFGQSMLPLDTAMAEAPQNSIIGGATLWTMGGHDAVAYDGVAAFFAYLSSAEVQATWHQETGYVPITTAAYDLSREQGFYAENPGTDTAIKQLSLNAPTANSKGLRFGNFVQIRDVINEELELLWAGEKTAVQALDDAARRGNALLRAFERTVH
ncbi:MAG: sn-glycerol-3-phosphate ABC transporter substrate-binding protein UgpB [Pseudomonadota bacterium]